MRKQIFRVIFCWPVISLAAFILFSSESFTGTCQSATTLKYIVREPKIKSSKPPVLILLHGYGSNEKDLFSFSDQLPGKYLVISARAPISLGENTYAWYQVDFSADQHVRSFNFQQEEQSRKMIIDLIGQLKKKYVFDEQQVYLCGFSQGAILSYGVALTRPDLIRGIAVMSGVLLKEIKPLIVSKDKLQKLKVFISHGTNDNRLALKDAEASVAYIKTLGMKPAFKEYPAGHEINAEMLRDLIAWLN